MQDDNPTTETPPPDAAKATETGEFAEARAGYRALLEGFRSIHLATVDGDGTPEASYAPAVMDESGRLYVHVSELASHMWNLRSTGRASVLIIEDEGTCDTIFARKRVAFRCNAEEVPRLNAEWEAVLARLEAKHGKMAGYLKTMADFHLMRLTPLSGRLVLGFGKAYDVGGAGMREVGPIGAVNGGGHRKESDTTEE